MNPGSRILGIGIGLRGRAIRSLSGANAPMAGKYPGCMNAEKKSWFGLKDLIL